ncbi:hypothetical protein HZC53_00845 [Candidatus Uhrbacteria bacterium]|nr:hypothetical protein [Candidatus Uhrbacteria bacterium]
MGLFEDILNTRKSQGGLAHASMVSPLTVSEEAGILQWIHDQLLASRPDRPNWRLFWDRQAPFFCRELAFMLLGKVSTNILQCADPVTDPTLLKHWKDFDHGMRFVLERTDACRCLLFDADFLLVMDRNRPVDACRLGPKIAPDGSRGQDTVWQSVGSSDLLDVLLLSWESAGPKWKFARERLCDIANNVLTKSRQP